MSFNRRETSIVKGMLARGDKQHDIAAFFGVNGGRIGEVSTRESEWAYVEPMPEDQLPPKPSYPSPYETLNAKASIDVLVRKVSMTQDTAEAKKLAVDGMWAILGKM